MQMMTKFTPVIRTNFPKLKHLLVYIIMTPLRIWRYIIFLRYKSQLNTITPHQSREYEAYLYNQLKRTLPKKNAPIQLRTNLLVDRTADFVNLSISDVLCIGCRNSAEIDHFHCNGSKSVIGIDLFSDHQNIYIMDMHYMTFPDNSFDVIYSSHSLEHSHDVSQVTLEIIRILRPGGIIAIEVPIAYQTRGADLVDFKNLKTLEQHFEPFIDQVLWSDQQPPLSPTNQSGTEILRAIIKMGKPS